MEPTAKPTYSVRTRNFAQSPRLYGLLNLPTAYDHTPPADYDQKFAISTRSLPKALMILAYWLALSPFSGGWTYIISDRNQKSLHEYKIFYI